MKVLVDYREPEEVFELFEGIALKTVLDVGDYLVDGFVFERKTISDFLQSLFDGRLFEQLIKMKEKHSKCFLIIEGIIDVNVLKEPSVFYGAIQQIIIGFGIPIIFSESLKNSVDVLLKADNFGEKMVFMWDVKIVRVKNCNKIQESILTCFPGIGINRARQLLEYFGCLKKVFTANNKKLINCKGISRKLAEKIIDIINK